jgi:RND family efflux transporter MFP subunit
MGIMKKIITKHKQAFWFFTIIIAVSLLVVIVVISKKPPEKEVIEKLAPLVEVMQVEKKDRQMIITGYGTARAKVEVEIVPQVSGKIDSVNPQFKVGGFIKAGEEILKIDPRDYKLAVRQAEASVADAEVKLELEKSEAAVAIAEWKQLHPGTEPNSPLVLREPQIRQAQALVESAKAALETAELGLERTSIKLPVNVRVIEESADLGQFVSVGQSIGRAYGIDAIEIEVPLEDKDLQWFSIPDAANGNENGSEALVIAEYAGKKNTWKGYVKRTVGQIDFRSRLASVVIEVPKPFERETALLPGIFTEVQIQGETLQNVFAIPRNSLHNKNQVWVLNDEKLHITELDIARSDKNFAYATNSLEDECFIVTSSLDAVIDGMKVRTRKAEEKDEEPKEDK